jgi:hypothetical protein
MDKAIGKLNEYIKEELSHFDYELGSSRRDYKRIEGLVDEYITKGNENISSKVAQCSIDLAVLTERRNQDEALLNTLNKLTT